MTETKYPKHKVGTVVRLKNQGWPVSDTIPADGAVGVVTYSRYKHYRRRFFTQVRWFDPPPNLFPSLEFEYDELEEVRDGPA